MGWKGKKNDRSEGSDREVIWEYKKIKNSRNGYSEISIRGRKKMEVDGNKGRRDSKNRRNGWCEKEKEGRRLNKIWRWKSEES